ncbi:MAG: hypothetical protein RH948_16430 [Cyclobacteriaceae bacterium]
MERIVIVGYRPIPGKESELENLLRTHWQALDKEGLVSDRKPITVKAKDGTLIEIFGWKSKESIESAHTNKAVQALWGEYAKVCEYVPVGEVEECKNIFSEFTPL